MLHKALSRRVPTTSIRELATAYANATDNQRIAELINTASILDIEIALIDDLKQKIRGTPTKALIIDTIAIFTSATAMVAISPAVNSMHELSGSLKNILASSPALVGALLMLPLSIRFDKTGGKKELLVFRSIAILSLLGLTTLSSVSDLSTVNQFDDRYGAMLGLNIMAGSAYVSNLSFNNIVHWFPMKNIGNAISTYAGLGSIAPGLFLLLLQLSLNEIGLPVSFGISTATLSIGTIILAAYFTEPPYHQLRKFNLTHEQSVAIANLVEQERFPLPPDTNYLQLLKETINDFRAFTLGLGASSFGIYISSTITLYITLIELLKLTPTQAVLTTSAGSIWAAIVRFLTGKVIDKCDPSHGVYTFCTGNILTIAGALMMAIPRPLPNFAYVAGSQGLIFTGTGMSAISNGILMPHWASPNNDRTKDYSTGIMSGVLSTSGTLWGLILPLITALFVLNKNKDGYQNFFYLVAGLATLSSLVTTLANTHLKKPLQTSTRNCWASMFHRNYNAGRDEVNIELGVRERPTLSANSLPETLPTLPSYTHHP